MRRVVVVLLVIALFLGVTPARAGYTHYWKWHREPDPATLQVTLAEMKRLAVAKRAILADAQGWTGEKATFLGTCSWGEDTEAGAARETPCITFNGILDQGHETFAFPLAPFTNDPNFSFVKTAYKPYDVVAAACLIVAHDHFANDVLEISSDGEWPGDFRDGAALYEKTLGRTAKSPLAPPEKGNPGDEPPPAASEENLSRGQVILRWGIFGLLGVALLIGLSWRRR